jgi:hypothetical protein
MHRGLALQESAENWADSMSQKIKKYEYRYWFNTLTSWY